MIIVWTPAEYNSERSQLNVSSLTVIKGGVSECEDITQAHDRFILYFISQVMWYLLHFFVLTIYWFNTNNYRLRNNLFCFYSVIVLIKGVLWSECGLTIPVPSLDMIKYLSNYFCHPLKYCSTMSLHWTAVERKEIHAALPWRRHDTGMQLVLSWALIWSS